MSFLWNHWRVMRVKESASELAAGLYVAALEKDLTDSLPSDKVRVNVIGWEDDVETKLPRSYLVDLMPDEQARCRYALDEEEYEPNKELAQLGLAYMRAMDDVCVAAQPQGPWDLPHVIDYATADLYLLELDHLGAKLTEAEEQAMRSAWIKAVTAQQQLLEAELRLFA